MKKNLLLSAGSLLIAAQSWAQCVPVITCTPDTTYTILTNGVCDTNVFYNEPTMTGCPTGTLMLINCDGSGSNFPTGTNNVSYVTMDQVYFVEDFKNNNAGWTLGTEWGIGSATAGTGSVYNNDPANDYSCSQDNGIAGVVIGGNASTGLHPAYWLTSPVIDLSATTGSVYLDYYRFLNSDYTPYMQNYVEVYNGASWVQIWATGGTGTSDAAWNLNTHDVTAYVNANFQVRWGFMIGSGGVYTISSWNLDDIMLRGATPVAVGDTCSFNVIINDGSAPVPDVMVLPDVNGDCMTMLSAPTATDGCTGTVTGTTSDPLSYSVDGSYVVTWTYDDGSGNTVDQTQNVNIDDIIAPTPDLVTLPDTAGCTISVITPTATDDCVGVITGTTSDPLTYSTDGTYTVTWTFDDGNGNTATQSQTVIISNPVSVSGIGADEIAGSDGSIDITVTGGAPVITFDWDNDGTGDFDDVEDLAGLTAGSYTVVVVDGNGCTATDTYTIGSQVGITENSAAFSIYPNPTAGLVVINLANIGDESRMIITNSLGQIVLSYKIIKNQFEVDLSQFEDGIYYIEISDVNFKSVQKIIKQ